jgi:hypothetical protein
MSVQEQPDPKDAKGRLGNLNIKIYHDLSVYGNS